MIVFAHRPLSVKQLSSTLPLLDVADTEATCRSILDRALRSRGVHYLAPDLYDEALTFFMGEAWPIAKSYVDWCEKRIVQAGLPVPPPRDPDPDLVRGRVIVGRAWSARLVTQSFNTYLHRWLPLRLADWYRGHYVDIRYVDAPTFVGEEYAELAPERPRGQSWDEDAGSVEEVESRGVLVMTQSFSLSGTCVPPIGEAI